MPANLKLREELTRLGPALLVAALLVLTACGQRTSEDPRAGGLTPTPLITLPSPGEQASGSPVPSGGGSGTPSPGSGQGNGQSGPNKLPPVSACELITPAEIKSTLGVGVVGQGYGDDVDITHTCAWQLENNTLGVLSVIDTELGYAPDQAPDQFTMVDGVGKEAAYASHTSPAADGAIWVKVTGRAFLLQVAGQAGAFIPEQAAFEEAARIVVGRLT